MTQTVFITGSSSGIGRASAELFVDKGWNVVATMRNPEAETELVNGERVLLVRLDVTDPDSIESAVQAGVERFGSIDVLVNNAGYGAYGPLEATPREKMVRQFDTNVIGLLDVTKAVIPHFRGQGSGIIINISSIGGRIAFPLGSLYHGSKWAVEGISEALIFEMEPIGVRIKIIEPGIIDTDFSGRSLDISNDETLVEYQPVIGAFAAASARPGRHSSPPELVAEVIYAAATDGTDQLRYVAGDDAKQILGQRAAVDDETFIAGIRQQFGLSGS